MLRNTKNINIEISYECWKRLKIVSIHRNMTLQDVIKEILEKSYTKKGNLPEIGVENEIK